MGKLTLALLLPLLLSAQYVPPGGGGSSSGAAGGDLSGTYPNPTVTGSHLSAPLPLLQGGTGNTTGLAASATQLAADPANCSPGNYPLGVDQFGVAQNCTTAPGSVSGTPIIHTTSYALVGATDNLITQEFNGVSLTATIPTGAGLPATTKLIVTNAAATTLSFTLATQVNGSGTLAAMPANDVTRGGYTTYIFEIDPNNGANWQMRGPNQGSGGGGSGGTTRGAVGAGGSGLPACTTAGTYFGTDASTVSMCDGSSWWNTWNGLAGFNFPVIGSFTQTNFSTATAVQQGPFIALAGTATATGNPRLLVKALPSTPYTVIACWRADLNQQSQSVGMMLTTSATFGVGNTEQLRITNFTDPNFHGAAGEVVPMLHAGYYQNLSWTYTGVSVDAQDNTTPMMPGDGGCLGFEDDGTGSGTAKKLGFSRDGINFITLLAEAHTGYITATNIGLFTDSDTASCSGCAASIPHALLIGYREYSTIKW